MRKILFAIFAVATMAWAGGTLSHASFENGASRKKKTESADSVVPLDSAAKVKADSIAKVKADSIKADSIKKHTGEYWDLMKKDSTFRRGLFTVRHIDDKYYFEVPDSMLGRYVLAVTRFTSVPQNFGKFAGEEINENTVYFEKRDKKTMLLRAFVLTQLADKEDNISKTLEASTVDPIVASFHIVQANPDSVTSLIDVTGLFKNENEIVGMGASAKRFKLNGIMPDRTFIDTMKVFPINVEIGTTRTYACNPEVGNTRASWTGSVTVGLNTSMVLLPKTPMRKRLGDERVGYFNQSFTRFSDDQHKAQREVMIARYNLVPKDVAAYKRGQLVEPVKPIVYYIDPATPKKWVPYLIQGINDWNVAFEAAGFKNAIQGKEWPKDRPDMSVDDARYCVLRYLPAEIENAYGPHVSDPRSGEIIESHICWYHNVMSLLTKWYMVQCGPLDKRARTMNMDDKLMGQLIRFVSSHEVGHTLGLRHNMCASSATPVEKLRDKAWVKKNGHTSSIMDYARFNYVAQPEDGLSEEELFPRIGDYDKWAIKWGYQYRPEFKDEYVEKDALREEVTKVVNNNPRLWYLGGEGYSEDPRAQTEDLSDNSMKASDYGIKNLQRVIDNLPEWTKQGGEQTEDLESMYQNVQSQYMRYVSHVYRNVTGNMINTPGKKKVICYPAERRKEVIDWLDRNLFEFQAWLYPQNIVDKLFVNPIVESQRMQVSVLQSVLSSSNIQKLANDYVYSPDAITVEDYLDALFSSVWKPIEGDDAKAKCRRALERGYVDVLNDIINDPKASATNESALYLYEHLNKVEEYCKAQQNASGINGLHYKDLLNKIKLIRERKTTVKPNY